MSKKILIDASYAESAQIAVVDKNKLVDLDSTTNSKKMIKGNIYLAKVTRVEPSLQAAFIDYGDERNGFVPFAEIHSDYYDIPSKYKEDSEESDSEETKEEVKGDSEKPDLDAIVDEVLEDDSTGEQNSDEQDIEVIKKKNADKYKIQEVIKRNQILLVQTIKEERGNKGAAFTTYISLAGRCCVIMPNSGSKGGVSKKIEDSEERRRLKTIVEEISEANPVGVIIRTIGMGRSKDNIEKDYNYLVKLWNNIREKTLVSNAPAFIHSEDSVFKRVIRDLYDHSVDSIVIDGKDAFQEMKDVVKNMSSEDEINIIPYQDKVPIFNKYKIDEQILSLYNPVAYTESGAYIVINPTEALIAIDVNSGKSTGDKNIEKMAVNTNVDAARELVRQIRLRDLSGIIVIDFIDMMEAKNKRLVEKTLKDLLYKDKAKVQVGSISSLGLLEISRQRLKPNFLEANTILCQHCNGKGVVRSHNSNANTILKTVAGEITDKTSKVNVFASAETVLYILNHKREDVKDVENKHSVSIIFHQDSKMSLDGFAVEVIESNGPENKPARKDRRPSQNNKKERRFRKNKKPDSSNAQASESTTKDSDAPKVEESKPVVVEEEKAVKKPSNRVRRKPKKSPKEEAPASSDSKD
jgi:ribonuclease E